MTSASTEHLATPSHLAATLRVPVPLVLRAADEGKVPASMTLNGCPYYDDKACRAIARHLKGKSE